MTGLNLFPLSVVRVSSQVLQLSVAPLLAKCIEREHFKKHLYNEEILVSDPEITT
jgi:hypothetical protein